MTSSPPLFPSSFTLFPHLPPEIRLQIYHHACHPRVTTLTYHPSPRGPDDAGTFHCPTHPPTLLHISRESRAEGLRLYVKCHLPDQTTDEEEERYFYHHPHHDTLYLPRPPLSTDPQGLGYAAWAREFATARMPRFARSVVRRLAVDYVPGEVRRPWEVFGKVCLIRGCPLLEEAYLVVNTGLGAGSGAGAGAGGGGGRDGDGDASEGREVEFVDPGAGDEVIVGIMERVRESFRVEVGEGMGLGKDVEDEGGVDQVGLELIPKAKVLSAWGCRHVACAS
ncbi:hypothetical protein C8A01DRAFT_48365 [Parachaetomium inaequale]|uniref:2EXR domain-containing protein n=1 Tax=Parachaetomium inaequale TaxID=2588326 RepID=A0AAN6PDJ7_9PEZI|nr:hypothetical protein C8A01DRAFT_48365 [Parachaetomium inaequale]